MAAGFSPEIQDRLVDPELRRLRGPGGRGLDAHARTRAPAAIDRGALVAPPLVVRQPLLDGEHVAVLDDQIVAAQAERRHGAEAERARIPPGHGIVRVLDARCR